MHIVPQLPTTLGGLRNYLPAGEPKPAQEAFDLTAEEGATFLRIVSDSLFIQRRDELFVWLQGELQRFLPHQILISVWGEFSAWNLRFDILSSLAGARTEKAADCDIDELLRRAYSQWLRAGCQPVRLDAAMATAPLVPCACPIHRAFRGMRSLVVHGVCDKRSGSDSLYLALSSQPFPEVRRDDRTRFISLAHLLFCQIDTAWRKVASCPVDGVTLPESAAVQRLGLSVREHEILNCLCLGSTNEDIAAALRISVFTVKNHLQRIFRRIGVSSRTQAAAKYHQALRESGAFKQG